MKALRYCNYPLTSLEGQALTSTMLANAVLLDQRHWLEEPRREGRRTITLFHFQRGMQELAYQWSSVNNGVTIHPRHNGHEHNS